MSAALNVPARATARALRAAADLPTMSIDGIRVVLAEVRAIERADEALAQAVRAANAAREHARSLRHLRGTMIEEAAQRSAAEAADRVESARAELVARCQEGERVRAMWLREAAREVAS